MAAIIGKRKREDGNVQTALSKKHQTNGTAKTVTNSQSTNGTPSDALQIQIVTGSYERALHGLSASIPRSTLSNGDDPLHPVIFQDTFLFAAHSSAVRCLAISPSGEDADKRYLATGSSDERITVYSLSTAPPPLNAKPKLPSLSGAATAENPRNRSLGSLIHHDRAITSLSFPTKSKLFSAAEDATISISRTRDWTVLSSIKAPIPKPQGRPSGDTAGPGEIPAGVNDFAIHPSQKLMLSTGRGEKCMRLWNLMTGKKAGVLNFDRELLIQVGESKFSSGEGRRVLWDQGGENYLVGFERGAAMFGIDSKPKVVLRPSPSSKVHQMRFVPGQSEGKSFLAISTEDGRILLYNLSNIGESDAKEKLPQLSAIAHIGGKASGIEGRVKDFDVLEVPGSTSLLFVAGSSDGAIRLWLVNADELVEDGEVKQIGSLIAIQETGERITCIGSFVLDGLAIDGVDGAAEEMAGAESDEEVSGEDS